MVTLLVFLILILQFFRNPKRHTDLNDKQVISPVDGKVVVIEEVFEKEYFKEKRLQVSVFMSPLNVHVTRYPIGGKVLYSKYHPGKFLVAWHPKASEENERQHFLVERSDGVRIGFTQIAGLVARRIVAFVKEGDSVANGQRIGLIRFGSRVDVYLPHGTSSRVIKGQRCVAGETVIADLGVDQDLIAVAH